MKIKLLTGFREDQQYSIDSEEAHKAYYLFLNPEKRGVFSNGLAIMGSDIRRIEPDWNGTMGWNPLKKLDEYDWKELTTRYVSDGKSIKDRVLEMMGTAKQIAQQVGDDTKILSLPLSEIEVPKETEFTEGVKQLSEGMHFKK